jgi:hypothetical protein
MNQKQKMLLIGGATVTAVILFASFSKASTKSPSGPAPAPGPKPTVKDSVPVMVGNGPFDSPFGKFMPCSGNATMVEPYNTAIRTAIDASYDIAALQGAASVYHDRGCEALATRAAQRAEALSAGGNVPGSGQHVVMAEIPEYGAAESACDLSGVMVDGQRGADIEAWIMSRNDPALLKQVAVALRRAEPPCEVLAKKADVQSAYLNGVLANIAAQNAKMIADANAAAAGASEGTGQAEEVSAVDTVKGWFS